MIPRPAVRLRCIRCASRRTSAGVGIARLSSHLVVNLGGESCIFGKGLLLAVEHLLRLASVRFIDLAQREPGVDQHPIPNPRFIVALEHLQAYPAWCAADLDACNLLYRVQDLEHLAGDG